MVAIKRKRNVQILAVEDLVYDEHTEQSVFFRDACFEHRNNPEFMRSLLFAVPNGAYLGKNGSAVMRKLKDEGLTPGVADVIYLQPRGGYPFLVLEFKRSDKRNRKDGGLSSDQIFFLGEVEKVGGMWAVCYKADQAVEIFQKYMDLPLSAIIRARL